MKKLFLCAMLFSFGLIAKDSESTVADVDHFDDKIKEAFKDPANQDKLFILDFYHPK